MIAPSHTATSHRFLLAFVSRDVVFAVFVSEGALLSYGPSAIGMVVQSADYVDRVLRGARPGELPIQRPVKFDFAVNLKTAKALGVTIAPSMVQRADEVIR